MQTNKENENYLAISCELEGKKLTISYYLNKKLKPQKRKNNVSAYPLYIKILFGRETFLLKSRSIDWHLTDEEVNCLLPKELASLFYELNWIKKIIEDVINSGFERDRFMKMYLLFTATVRDKFSEIIESREYDISTQMFYFLINQFVKKQDENTFLSYIFLEENKEVFNDLVNFFKLYLNDKQTENMTKLFELEKKSFIELSESYLKKI